MFQHKKSSAKLKSKVSANAAEPRSENSKTLHGDSVSVGPTKREKESIILRHTSWWKKSQDQPLFGCMKPCK